MIAAVVVLFAAGAAAELPVAERSLTAAVGADLNGPVLVVTAAPRPLANGLLPFVAVDAGLAGPRLAVQGGLQLRHDVCPGFAVRGGASGGLFVVGSAGGVGATVDVDAVFVFGGVDLYVGPVVFAAAALDSGRVTPGGSVGVVVDLVDHVEFIADGVAGYDLGGAYGHAGDGAFAASLVAGVRVTL